MGLLVNAPMSTDIQRELINQMTRDPQSALNNFANDFIKNKCDKFNEQVKSKKTITISVYLTRDQQTQLEKWMPIYNYNFTGTSHSKHSIANAARTIMQHYIVSKFNKNERFLDVGSNYVNLFKSGIYNVHCCCPILDHRDSKRATERAYQFRKYISELPPDSEQMRQYKLFEDQKHFRVCDKRAQECGIQAKAAMFLDSAYDIDLIEMAYIMDAHGCELAYGNFFFSPSMLVADQGNISEFDITWVIREEYIDLDLADTTTINLKQKFVYYYFKGDSEMGYRHRLDNLVRLATQQAVTTDISQYVIERKDLDGMLFFSLVKVAKPSSFVSHLNFRLWDHSLKDKKFVRVFDYDFNTKIDFNDKLRQQIVCVSSDMFNRLYSYALRITEENKDSAKDIFSYASSLNTRFTANGVEITPGDRMPAEELYRLAYSMFFLTFCERAKQKLISRSMVNKELVKRRLSQAGLIELLKIYLTNGSVEGLDTEDLKLNSRGWFKGFKEKARNAVYDIILANDQSPGIDDKPIYFEFNEAVYALETEFAPVEPSYGRLQPLHDALKFMLVPSALEQLADKLSTACRMSDPQSKEFGKLVDLRNLTLRQLAKLDPDRARKANECWSPTENCERLLDTILPLRGSDTVMNDGLVHHNPERQPAIEPNCNGAIVQTSKLAGDCSPNSTTATTVCTRGLKSMNTKWWYSMDIEAKTNAPGLETLRQMVQEKLVVINVSGTDNLCGARALAKALPKTMNLSSTVIKVQLASLATSDNDDKGFSKDNFSLEQLRYYTNKLKVALHVVYSPAITRGSPVKAIYEPDSYENPEHHSYLLNDAGRHWLSVIPSANDEGADWRFNIVVEKDGGKEIEHENPPIDPPDLTSLNLNFDNVTDDNRMFVGQFEEVERSSNPETDVSGDTIRGGASVNKAPNPTREADGSETDTDSSIEYCKWRKKNPELKDTKRRRDTESVSNFRRFAMSNIKHNNEARSPVKPQSTPGNDIKKTFNPLKLLGGFRSSNTNSSRSTSITSQPQVKSESVMYIGRETQPESQDNFMKISIIKIKNFKTFIKNFISEKQYKKFLSILESLFHVTGYISTTMLLTKLFQSGFLDVIVNSIFFCTGQLGAWFLSLSLSYKLAIIFGFLYLLGCVPEPYYQLVKAGYLPDGLYNNKQLDRFFLISGLTATGSVGNFSITDALYKSIKGANLLLKTLALPFAIPFKILSNWWRQVRIVGVINNTEAEIGTCLPRDSPVRPRIVHNGSEKLSDPYTEGFCNTQTYMNGCLSKNADSDAPPIQEALLEAVLSKLPEGSNTRNQVVNKGCRPSHEEPENVAQPRNVIDKEEVKNNHTELLFNYYKYVNTELRELENHSFSVYEDLRRFDTVTVENLRDKRYPVSKARICKRISSKTYSIPKGLEIEVLDCVFDPYVPVGTSAVDDVVDCKRTNGALIPVYHKSGAATFQTDFDSPEVLITEHIANSLVYKTKRALSRNKIDKVDPKRTFELVDGVPGCGKTMAAINDMDGNTLLAIETKIACEDARRKANAKGKPSENIRTAGSCIINGSKKFPKLIIDEGLMMHPGAIVYLSELVGASHVKVYGDKQQIAFIPRVGDRNRTFKLPEKNGRKTDINWEITYRTLSHRVPMDVAVVLRKYYDHGFWTTNAIEKSIVKRVIANVAQVPKESNWQYICFTRAQAEKLRNLGYKNACTIGESEGSTFKNVRMVRGETILDAGLRRETSQAIVALSRHTNNFEYWTIDQSKDKDLVFELVDEARKIDNVARAHGDFKANNNKH
uniref:Uncharacterized protein n=1 Tax=Uromyces fabae virus TaxID=3069272 RepID=A0AA51UAF8_9VIRU|nr:hypothetical protein [Uromyces fabae virus]